MSTTGWIILGVVVLGCLAAAGLLAALASMSEEIRALPWGAMIAATIALADLFVVWLAGREVWAAEKTGRFRPFFSLLLLPFGLIALFLFLVSAYYRLTNARLSVRDVIPGAIIGAALLELTLQALPLFVYVTGDVVTLQVLGTTFLLLVWLYLMANVIVFGAAYNFELTYARTGRAQGKILA